MPTDLHLHLTLTHAVLVGLTPLIPLPFVDDLIKTHLQRQMVIELGKVHGLSLTPPEVEQLADDRGGCVSGCLNMLVLYPIKKLLRKLVFILEWQRAINLISHTFYHGYLLDYAFQQNWYTPGEARRAHELRNGLERARQGANTNLVTRVVGDSFNHSRDLVVNTAQQFYASLTGTVLKTGSWFRLMLFTTLRKASPRLARALRNRFPAMAQRRQTLEKEIGARLDKEAPQNLPGVLELIQQLQANILALPEDHFEILQKQLAEALKKSGQ